jgi:hypothetical protein
MVMRSFIIFKDLSTGKTTEISAPPSYVVSPPNVDVYYHLRDCDKTPHQITCWNNHVYRIDPAKSMVGEALNLSFIQNYKL